MNKSQGFTLFELIVVLGIIVILGSLIFGGISSKEALKCQNTLISLTATETACLQEKAADDQNCIMCGKYNAAITAFNANSKCKDYGPILTYTCPNPPDPTAN